MEARADDHAAAEEALWERSGSGSWRQRGRMMKGLRKSLRRQSSELGFSKFRIFLIKLLQSYSVTC